MKVIEVIDLARDMIGEPLESSRTFPDNTSNFYADATLLKYLNTTQLALQNKIVTTFGYFFTTSSFMSMVKDQDNYEMPSNTLKIIRVENVEANLDPKEIFPIHFNDKDNLPGLDHYYAVKGNQMVFRPIPSQNKTSNIKVFFEKRLDTLVSQSEVSLIPLEYHEILSWGIYKKALIQQESDPTMAVAEYSRQVKDMIKELQTRQAQAPRMVRKRFKREYNR